MRLLLDTHALIWWLAGDPSLSTDAKAAIIDPGNEIFVSAVSAWEIATKYRIGRLPQAAGLALDVSGALASQGFIELPITVLHGQTAGCLPGPHRDPFDRMLIAQATLADLVLVSNEAVFDRYAVRRLWRRSLLTHDRRELQFPAFTQSRVLLDRLLPRPATFSGI